MQPRQGPYVPAPKCVDLAAHVKKQLLDRISASLPNAKNVRTVKGLTRYGIAFVMEESKLGTQEGSALVSSNVKQMGDAILEQLAGALEYHGLDVDSDVNEDSNVFVHTTIYVPVSGPLASYDPVLHAQSLQSELERRLAKTCPKAKPDLSEELCLSRETKLTSIACTVGSKVYCDIEKVVQICTDCIGTAKSYRLHVSGDRGGPIPRCRPPFVKIEEPRVSALIWVPPTASRL